MLSRLHGLRPLWYTHVWQNFGTLCFHSAQPDHALFATERRLHAAIFDSIYVSGWAGLVSEVYLISFVCCSSTPRSTFLSRSCSLHLITHRTSAPNAQKIAGQAWATALLLLRLACSPSSRHVRRDGISRRQLVIAVALKLHYQQPSSSSSSSGGVSGHLCTQVTASAHGSGQCERMRAHAPKVGFVSWDQSSHDSASARGSHPHRESSLLPVEDARTDRNGCTLQTEAELTNSSGLVDGSDSCENFGLTPPPPMPGESICESPLAPSLQHSVDPGHESLSSTTRWIHTTATRCG